MVEMSLPTLCNRVCPISGQLMYVLILVDFDCLMDMHSLPIDKCCGVVINQLFIYCFYLYTSVRMRIAIVLL